MAVPDLDELIDGVIVEADTDDPLAQLRVAVRRRNDLDEIAESVLDHFVEQARGAGCSWNQIGAELGVTKQAAQQRHANEQSVARRLLARVRPRDRSGGGLFGGRFGAEARQAVVEAQAEARALGHGHLGTEHLLLGILRSGDGPAVRSLGAVGLDHRTAHERVVAAFGHGEGGPAGHIPFTPRAKKVLELALRESLRLRHDHIGPEHVLLAMAREGDGGAIAILQATGIGAEELEAAVHRQLGEASDPPGTG